VVAPAQLLAGNTSGGALASWKRLVPRKMEVDIGNKVRRKLKRQRCEVSFDVGRMRRKEVTLSERGAGML